MAKKRAHGEVVALQQGQKEARAAWEIICDISRNAYQELYDLLEYDPAAEVWSGSHD